MTFASVLIVSIRNESEQVSEGKVHFEDLISRAQAEQVQGSGVLPFFDAPRALNFKDVLAMMVVMSDNTANNLAVDHLGLTNTQSRIVKLALKDTWLYKQVFTPVPPGMTMQAD